MMNVLRRFLPVVVLLALVAGGGILLLSGGSQPPTYEVELDNAFGLTKDAELRSAGVEVGSVTDLRVDRRTARAIVEVTVRRNDFGDLRKDATCSVEPQSLIGEYFLDCEPGSKERLEPGDRIPVEQTTGTIPPDLVQSVMERPQREQLDIILVELGAALAARGPEVREIIRRAIPALRETDEVLKILADNRETLRTLTRDADTVLARLADNRRDVRRFVREARDTATISANRRVELAETIRRLPGFLRELRPTLRDLGTVADRQTPALRDLRASAPQLRELLNRLGPFADASRPAIDALGEASVAGTRAARVARPTIGRVRRLGETAKDPSTNLRFVLEHLDDRNFAVEPSPVSPGGRGFTGLEAFLRYPFVQSQAINIFDTRGYSLKLNALANECSNYTNAQSARDNPSRTKLCNAWLGPNQPGVTTPDPSGSERRASTRARASRRRSAPRREAGRARRKEPAQAPERPREQERRQEDARAPRQGEDGSRARDEERRPPQDAVVQELLDELRDALPGSRPAPELPAPPPVAPDQPAGRSDPDQAAEGLLDFLLGS